MIDLQLLKERFGLSYLRPYQELVIDYVLNREEGRLLAVLPTGGGKSLCFMYPLAATGKRALLLYPLKSLMHDQERRFSQAKIPSVVLEGGLEREERERRMKEAGKKGVSIITNPEMLQYLVDSSRARVLKDISMVVIDEAHTVVTWGETFRPAFLELPRLLEAVKPAMLLAFTATADREIGRGIKRIVFSGRQPYVVHASADRENLFYHSVHSLSKEQDLRKLLRPLSSRPALVFCRSRALAEKLAETLSNDFEIKHYHAGLSKEEKAEKEEWFLRSSEGVLAATTAYGMGVDKKDIRTVIHYSLPDSASSFLQEAGRGGRDGRETGSYVLWYGDEESPMGKVFRASGCLRHALLSLMNEERLEDSCLSCSSCVEDGYVPAGLEAIAHYLRFHPLIKQGRLPEALYGRLKGWTLDDLRRAEKELVSYGFVRVIIQRLLLKRKICYNFLKKKGATK